MRTIDLEFECINNDHFKYKQPLSVHLPAEMTEEETEEIVKNIRVKCYFCGRFMRRIE